MKKFEKIYIEITNICNFDCSFCPKTTRTKKYMSKEEFQNILEKINENTKTIALHIKGEPTLHPKLIEFLELANTYKKKVKLTTNGSLLSQYIENIEIFDLVNQLNISMHSYVDKGKLDFDKINSILKYADEISKKTNCIVSLRFWNLDNNHANFENLEIYSAIEKYFGITKLNEKMVSARSYKIQQKLYVNQDNKFIWPDTKLNIDNEVGKCYGLRKQLGILVDGTVVPCCLDNNGDIALGNIFNQELDDIMESNRVQNMINGFNSGKLTEKLCQNCDFIKKFKNA